ncbi:MAG: hypothetical protein JKY95_07335 [Planctomycetaceae bacterium]|nr:hypothetical protein [Planctomycetaceae bacterium]
MKKKQLRISLIALSVVCMASLVWACSVPVFRYALERWPNDIYEVIVFHKGKLTDEQRKIADDLTEAGAAGKEHANVQLKLVDLDTLDSEKPEDADTLKLWDSQKTETLPWITVKYPAIYRKLTDVWSGELTSENIALILDSPARREIARRLLKGETAVWILLESGSKDKDDAAFEKLQAELLLAQQDLKLPKIDEADIAQGLVSVDETGLKLQFSIVRLSREDAQEKILVEMLLGSEDDLRDFNEPMALPVFGRGRVMYALIGKGINADTIRQTCQELIGPCTCEVKEENPGIDIITSVDWENLVQPFVEIDRELPPLPGFGGIVEVDSSEGMDSNEENPAEQSKTEDADPVVANADAAIPDANASADKADAGMSSVMRNVILLTAGGGVVVLLMSFIFLSRKSN